MRYPTKNKKRIRRRYFIYINSRQRATTVVHTATRVDIVQRHQKNSVSTEINIEMSKNNVDARVR